MVEFHPLSCVQELMLAYNAQFGFGASTWNQHIVFEFDTVDGERVEAVLRLLRDKHDILRTRLATVDGSFRQFVENPGHPLAHRSYAHVSDDSAAIEISRPFDLCQAPLWRSVLDRRADGGATLTVIFNHLVSDRQSERQFAREFVQLYDLTTSTLTSEPSPPRYSDFARWQRERVAEYVSAPETVAGWSEYEKSIRSMRVESRTASAARLPLDGVRAECSWAVSRDDTDRIAGNAKQLRTSVSSMLTAALSTAIARMPELSVGLLLGERSVRHPHRFANTLGPFPDPWPIDTALDRSTDFAESLDGIRRRALQAIDAPLPFHTLLGRIPWLMRAFQEHGEPVKMFHQFFGDGEFRTPLHSRITAVKFPVAFGEHSDIFGIHTMLGLENGALCGSVAYRRSSAGSPNDVSPHIIALAEEVGTILARQCSHAVRIGVAHHDADNPRSTSAQ